MLLWEVVMISDRAWAAIWGTVRTISPLLAVVMEVGAGMRVGAAMEAAEASEASEASSAPLAASPRLPAVAVVAVPRRRRPPYRWPRHRSSRRWREILACRNVYKGRSK